MFGKRVSKREAPPLNEPLPSGSQVILQISRNLDLSSLERGHSLECVLQRSEGSATEGSSAESGV